MKNIKRVLGIIAILAVVGVMVGCATEADPDDQIGITVTDIPAGANGFYTAMYLSNDNKGEDVVAITSAIRGIVNGRSTNRMVYPEGAKKTGAFDVEGNYYVALVIFEGETTNSTSLYAGITTDKVKITKGGNEVASSEFRPLISGVTWPEKTTEPEEPEPQPPPEFWGTYTATAYDTRYIETVVFTENSFRVSDNENPTDNDYLAFTIEKWEAVAVPTAYLPFAMKGYKFTGYITAGQPVDTNIYGGGTAPGFTQADITNQTECHMYIFTNGSGANYRFYRTTFSKETGTDSKAIVTTQAGAKREFTLAN